jgi:mannose-6-phosphate isomerase-like protein (cupin superfamily)
MTGSVTSVNDRGAVIGLEDSLARLPGRNGEPWAELYSHGTLSVEIFAPRGVDTQTPHTRDEVYFVARGRGEFVVDGERRAVETGDFLFVPALVEHRFENFSDDLALWVVFYGPEGGEGRTASG